jgi:hypothetical protein
MFIEPVSLQTRSTTTDKARAPGADYFLRKIWSKPEFSSVGVDSQTIEQLRQLVRTSHAKMMEKVMLVVKNRELARLLLPRPEDWIERLRFLSQSGKRLYLAYGSALVLEGSGDSFFIIAGSASEAKHVADKISNEINGLSDVTKDFGLVVDKILTGKAYGLNLIRQVKNVTDMKQLKTKNALEDEMIAGIGSICGSTLPNMEISFASPIETFEYDLLLPITADTIVDLEVKDYASVKQELHADSTTLKSKVILAPLDKARRLGAIPVIVTTGFASEAFAQMKEFAVSREITLLNPADYKTEIEHLLLDKLLRSTAGFGVHFTQYLEDWTVNSFTVS